MSARDGRKDDLSSTTGTGDILCPFFRAHGKTAVRCEDIYPETKYITTEFTDGKEKEFHERTYCAGHYKKCWLYDWAMRMMWGDGAEDAR